MRKRNVKGNVPSNMAHRDGITNYSATSNIESSLMICEVK